MSETVKVAACQVPYVHQDTERALANILLYAAQAESHGADLICFPECYLQGYVFDGENIEGLALDLGSPDFDRILRKLAPLRSTLVFGLIERNGQRLHNTAVIVARGKLVGRYRKAKLLAGENPFAAGEDSPIFDHDGLKFGINICNDLNHAECASAAAAQGARLLLCPCNNMMRKGNAEDWKWKHNPIRGRRAAESSLYLISADVTGEWGERISYGPTAVIAPDGSVTEQVELMQEGLIFHQIGRRPWR